MHDLAIVIVGFRSASWLPPCLDSLERHLGAITCDVVVVDNDGLGEVASRLGERRGVRRIECANHGFAHGNNQGIAATNSRYVLFLNPDTEILGGSLASLVSTLDHRPAVGAVGVIQQDPDGELIPSIRRFPDPISAIGDAIGAERMPRRPRWLGERELDASAYARVTPCDWVSGSFMLVRREALLAAGAFDERFFLFSEETDLARRIRQAGFVVEHWPQMRILHHTRKAGFVPKLEAQVAHSRRLYAAKHLAGPQRAAVVAAGTAGQALRLALARHATGAAEERRAAARAALRALIRPKRAPFEPPPLAAVRPDILTQLGRPVRNSDESA